MVMLNDCLTITWATLVPKIMFIPYNIVYHLTVQRIAAILLLKAHSPPLKFFPRFFSPPFLTIAIGVILLTQFVDMALICRVNFTCLIAHALIIKTVCQFMSNDYTYTSVAQVTMIMTGKNLVEVLNNYSRWPTSQSLVPSRRLKVLHIAVIMLLIYIMHTYTHTYVQ